MLAVICGCLINTSAGALEHSQAIKSSDADLQLAQDLLVANQFEETIQVLQSYHLTQKPSHQSLFLVGLASVELSLRTADEEIKRDLLARAVTAFREILIDEPGLIRVRLELARTFFLQNKDILAKEHFERVLAGNPPPTVKANIAGFLNTIHQRRRFRGSLSFQMVRESNINSGTTDKTIWFNSLPFTRSGADPKAETGMVIIGRGVYRHPVSDTVDNVTSIGLSRTEFPGSDFDRTVLDFYTGPEYHLSEQTRVSLQGYITSNFNDNSPNHKLGGRVRFQHMMDIRTNLDIQLNFGKRSYQSSENAHNNANEFEVGFSLNHRLTPTLTLDGGISVASSHIKNNPNQENRTFQLNTGVSSLLKSGLTIGFRVSTSSKSYRGQPGFPTSDGLAQKDKLLSLQATILHRNLTVWGFSPQLALIHEKLSTNAQASDFKNNLVQVTMVKQF